MNIGIDGSRAFIKDKTGTENYSFQIISHLAKIDKEDNFFIYLRPGNFIEDKKWPNNFKFITLNYPRVWTQAGLALETFKDPLDVLFVPAHTLPLIRKPGLKTVMTVHDLGAEYLPRTHQLKQRLYLGFITKWQLQTATKLIAVSEATKKDLIKRVGLTPDRVEVVYEAVDLEAFKEPSDATINNTLKRYDIEKESYFFFVGTIQPRKNLARLIKAFKLYIDKGGQVKTLVLAGGKGWLSEEIYELPKSLGIEDKVKFLGRVPDQDLPSLYKGATAFVFPSLFEGFGLPILGAFALGCPVVTSNTSSMPEVGGNGAIYINPESVEDIASGLEKVTKEKQKLVPLGKIQLKKFSWEDSAKDLLKIFKNI